MATSESPRVGPHVERKVWRARSKSSPRTNNTQVNDQQSPACRSSPRARLLPPRSHTLTHAHTRSHTHLLRPVPAYRPCCPTKTLPTTTTLPRPTTPPLTPVRRRAWPPPRWLRTTGWGWSCCARSRRSSQLTPSGLPTAIFTSESPLRSGLPSGRPSATPRPRQ